MPLDFRIKRKKGPPMKMEITHEHNVFDDRGRPRGRKKHTHRIGKMEFPHDE